MRSQDSSAYSAHNDFKDEFDDEFNDELSIPVPPPMNNYEVSV